MKKITRRKLIKNGAVAGAAGAAASIYSPLSSAALFVPTRRYRKKAVVVGSGFGGSVATLRLAEAGIETTLIERGKHWAFNGEGSYPTLGGTIGSLDGLANIDDGLLWTEPGLLPGSVGMLQEYVGGGIPIGLGAGLGGGSLVYGGVLLQPKREIFEQALPNLSYDDMDQVYYPKVLEKVSGGPIPDDILASPNYTSMRIFIENATAAGLEVVRSEVGFNWDIIREEIEGLRNPYASVGEWIFGCNSGAKNTLDRNYLADASATGKVEIRTLHNVTKIRKRPWNSEYEVHCEVLNENGKIIANHIFECQYLFMAAGSVHSTRLLLKAKALWDIPGINDGVGEEWGSNGDELKLRRGINASTAPIQGGPPSIAAFDTNNPYKDTGFMHAPSHVVPEFAQLQMGMVIPDQNSRATYNPLTDRLDVNWSKEANANATNALNHTMEKMTAVGGGTVGTVVSNAGTWHPIGGAVMGVACSELGEVFGSPNLFVIDGALIPGSTGAANPSLTIAANAERIMETLVNQLV